MEEAVDVEVAESNERAWRVAVDGSVWISENGLIIGEYVVEEIVLEVGACKRLSIEVLDRKCLPAGRLGAA